MQDISKFGTNAVVQFMGVELQFQGEIGQSVELPKAPGIYAEVLWPAKGIRIGQAKNIRSRHSRAKTWYRGKKIGRYPDQRKDGKLANYARAHGTDGLEVFVISSGPDFEDEIFRKCVEAHLHEWARTQTVWDNFNAESATRAYLY